MSSRVISQLQLRLCFRCSVWGSVTPLESWNDRNILLCDWNPEHFKLQQIHCSIYLVFTTKGRFLMGRCWGLAWPAGVTKSFAHSTSCEGLPSTANPVLEGGKGMCGI